MTVEEGILLTISAKVDNAVAGVNKVEKSLTGMAGSSKTAAASVDDSLTKIGAAANSASTGMAKAGASASKSSSNFTSLSRVIQDLPYGFTAIGNNLTEILPAAGAAGLAISGIVTAITFASIGFGAWTRMLGNNKDALKAQEEATKKAKEETESFKNGLDSARSGALATGISLRAFVDIAKDGNRPLQERNEALQQANKILGDHGDKLTLVNINTKAVTETVNKFTEALVQQAIAAKYADRIADLTIKQTQAAKEYNKEVAILNAGFAKNQQLTKEKGVGNVGIFELSNVGKQADIARAALNGYNAITGEIDATTKDFNNALSQSVSLMGAVSDKAKKGPKTTTVASIVKDLNKELRGLNGELDGGFIDEDAFDKSLVSAYQKAIKSLNEISGSQSKINELQLQVQPVIDAIAANNLQKELDAFAKKRANPQTVRETSTITPFADNIKDGPLHILDQIISKQDQAKKSAAEYNAAINDIGKSLVATFENVFTELIDGGGNALKIFGKFIQAVIMKLIAAAAIAAILTAIMPGGSFAGAATKGGTNFLSRFSAIGNLPFHAAGGMTTGPHAAMVGDNPSGKEAIIPLERMGEFLDNFSGNQDLNIRHEIDGDKLVLVIDRTRARQGRSFG